MNTNHRSRRFVMWRHLTFFLFGALMLALTSVPAPAVELIAASAVWHYQNTGTDLGTTWRNLGYDDSGWPAGPALLGFGDPDLATTVGTPANGVITYYFRYKFIYSNSPPVSCLEFRLIRDDGAAVYLNGTEIHRSNLPDGTLTYGTRASTDIDGALERWVDVFAVPGGALVVGENIVAVELHQSATGTNDAAFQLQLLGDTFSQSCHCTTLGLGNGTTAPAGCGSTTSGGALVLRGAGGLLPLSPLVASIRYPRAMGGRLLISNAVPGGIASNSYFSVSARGTNSLTLGRVGMTNDPATPGWLEASPNFAGVGSPTFGFCVYMGDMMPFQSTGRQGYDTPPKSTANRIYMDQEPLDLRTLRGDDGSLRLEMRFGAGPVDFAIWTGGSNQIVMGDRVEFYSEPGMIGGGEFLEEMDYECQAPGDRFLVDATATKFGHDVRALGDAHLIADAGQVTIGVMADAGNDGAELVFGGTSAMAADLVVPALPTGAWVRAAVVGYSNNQALPQTLGNLNLASKAGKLDLSPTFLPLQPAGTRLEAWANNMWLASFKSADFPSNPQLKVTADLNGPFSARFIGAINAEGALLYELGLPASTAVLLPNGQTLGCDTLRWTAAGGPPLPQGALQKTQITAKGTPALTLTGAPTLTGFDLYCCPETGGVKYVQRPDLANGVDYNTTFVPNDPAANRPWVLADDFPCTNTGPVTDIHLWGSWRYDQVDLNAIFTLAIWSDVPTNSPGGFSYPGQRLWTQTYTNGQYTFCLYTNTLESFENLLLNPLGFSTNLYYFCFYLPPTNPFVQTGTPTARTNYWLSVTVQSPGNSLFGWKSSQDTYSDVAVFGGDFLVSPTVWYPSTYTEAGAVSLAFKINTTNSCVPVTVSGPTSTTNCVGTTTTFTAIPSGTGPFTYQWTKDGAPIAGATSTIYSRLVTGAGDAGTYCVAVAGPCNSVTNCAMLQVLSPVPTLLCTDQTVSCGTAWSNTPPVILDPCCGSNHTLTYTSFTNGKCPAVITFAWTVTNCLGYSAVCTQLVTVVDTNPPVLTCSPNKTIPANTPWNFDPPTAFDLCCGSNVTITVLDTVTNSGPCPLVVTRRWQATDCCNNTSAPCSQQVTVLCAQTNTVAQKWLQVPDTTTNGIDVRITGQTMLANDFHCTATGPITEVRIWGSWLNDSYLSNACFCLGLWTDVPVSATNSYSMPGQLLCEKCFIPGQYTQFLYTNVYYEQFFDPFNPIPGLIDSQVWEYVFTMPANTCWWQTNGNTYWLSLRIPTGCFDSSQNQFGWKTCPTNWNDDAVYGYQPGNLWQELRRPPNSTNNLDLAFQILTETNPCPPMIVICPPDQTFVCGSNWSNTPPVVFDPCCGSNYTITYTAVTNSQCPTLITFNWKVTDCQGYTSNCMQWVTLVDTNPPVLTCASNKTVQCGTAWNFDPPTASDTCCGTNVTVIVLSTVTNSGPCPLVVTRTWKATDCCTNSTTCSQTVTITDMNPPVITCPSNIVVLTCSTNVAVTWTNIVTDCSSVTVSSLPPSGSFFSRDSTNLVTVTATDVCGYSNSCTFKVIVRRPSLSISTGISGGVLMIAITWPDGGILQETPNVVPTTWTDLPLATSPYTIIPAATRMFYRVRCP